MENQININPLVSVITPFYNGGDWLREAVESVFAQTYTHWELILADDGSKEEVTAIARDYAERYPDKIIYAEHSEHKNKGVTASRNLAISKSKGSLIAFLDSDDRWLPQKLERQVTLMQSHPGVGMLCEASEYWSSWEKPLLPNVTVKVGAPANRLYAPPELMYLLYPLGRGAAPCPSGIIMARDALIRTGGFEESFTGANQVYEDQAFLCKIYLGETVYISEDANNLYRQRSGSLMQTISQKKQYNRVRSYFLDWLQKYLSDHSLNDKRINDLLGSARMEINHPVLYRLTRKIRTVFNNK